MTQDTGEVTKVDRQVRASAQRPLWERDQDGRAFEEAEGGIGQNMNRGSRVNRCRGGKGRGHMVSKCCSTNPKHGLKTSRVFTGSFSSQQLELSGAVLMTLPGVIHGSKRRANQPGSDGPERMSHTSSNWCRRAPPLLVSQPQLKHSTMPHSPHSSDQATRLAQTRVGGGGQK